MKILAMAAGVAAVALAATSTVAGTAEVEIKAPPGSQILVDGELAGTVDRDGKLRIRLSPARHELAVQRDGRVIDLKIVQFGSGSRISLELAEWRSR